MKIICISGKARCVDKDTEFFYGKGWKKISEYRDGDKVLQYNKDGTASLVFPLEYISTHCDEMYEFENKRISQCLTPDHNCFYITSKGNLYSKKFKEVMNDQSKNVNGFTGRFITAFNYGSNGITLSDEEIKVMCAVICDASFIKNTNRCYLNLKKDRKKEELRKVLASANIRWEEKEYECMPGYTRFIFESPRKEKHFSEYWYSCSNGQLQVICDNICKWDGHISESGQKIFFTTDIETAEFLQFAFSSIGKRASLRADVRDGRKDTYCIQVSDNVLVSLYNRKFNKNSDIFKKIIPEDKKCYCFTVPSGMLVLRRHNKIFITGNCGKDQSSSYLKNILETKYNKKVLIIHNADLLKYMCKSIFEWDGKKDEKGRTLLQYVGTDVVRKQDPDFWVRFISSVVNLFPNDWDYVLVPDCRFPNEITYLKENTNCDVIHLRVKRPNYNNGLTEEQKNHPSETALDDVEPDYIIENSYTLDNLKQLNLLVIEHIEGKKIDG